MTRRGTAGRFDDLVMGDVVMASNVPDRRGVNPKPARPFVVIADTTQGVYEPLPAVGVSGTFREPIPADTHVLLTWNRQGTTRTGLTKNCAAVCDWLVGITHDNFVRTLGCVSDEELDAILDRVHALRPKPPHRS